MKKTILYTLAVLFLASCSSDLDDAMAKAEDCIEEKFDDEVIKHKSVKDALFAYDFDDARRIANCLPDGFFGSNGDKYNENRAEQIEKRMSMETWGVYENPNLDAMIEIVNAELVYFFDKGEFAHAKKLCDEAMLGLLYERAIPTAAEQMCNEGKFDDAVMLLSTRVFSESFDPKANWNNDYNNEVNEWNNLLDMAINKAILMKNEDAIPQLLLLYKSIAKKKRENSWYLSDDPKDDALKRVREGKEHL